MGVSGQKRERSLISERAAWEMKKDQMEDGKIGWKMERLDGR